MIGETPVRSSPNERDLRVPTACQVGFAVVLQKEKKIKMGSLIFLTHGKRCSDPSNQRAIIQSILDLMGHFFQKLSESRNSFMEKQIFLIILGKDQLLVNSFTLKGRVESSPSPQRVI